MIGWKLNIRMVSFPPILTTWMSLSMDGAQYHSDTSFVEQLSKLITFKSSWM